VNTTLPGRAAGAADAAGVLGASFAALCCAGTPIVLGALAAVGLSFLRKDAILWPLMLAALAIALWGFWQGARFHGTAAPLWLGSAGAAALVAGVIFVHGAPAMLLIRGGVVLLLTAAAWNAWSRRARSQRQSNPHLRHT
jgi:hypothetical protein